MPGEEIWFKVYAYDRKSQLTSKVTTNIQLGIFNSDGKQIDHKLFRAKKGFAHGNIAIDSTFVTGDYYLKASTRWMKNFEEDDSFVQKIRIINPKFQQKPATTNAKEYDVQFLPEGGHLLAGVKNVVGVKAIDDTGTGTKASGVILNSSQQEVARFQSNFLGLGRFSFTPEKGETYTANITLDSTKEIQLALPKSQERGVSIHVNNLSPKDVIIDLTTNDDSFETVKNESYQLLIHKDGVTKIIPMKFASLQERIVISKQDLFKGINTITLFDQNQNPLVERMFFNETPIKKYQIALQKLETREDSTIFALQTELQDSIVLHTSISVLPKGTKSYDPKHNILSAFYLKPYLKGTIEKPAYYFNDISRKKRYELDLLLLTQGWSRYSWQNIFNNPPQATYAFENGLTIRGTINNNLDKIKSFLLYATSSKQTQFIEYDSIGRFTVNNIFANNSEKLYFSSIDKKGKGKRPNMVAKIMKSIHPEGSIDVSNFKTFRSFYADLNSIPTNFINPETELLDEIVLQAELNLDYIKKSPFEGKIIKVNDSLLKIHNTIPKVLANIPKNGRRMLVFIDGVRQQWFHQNYLDVNSLHNYEDITVDYSKKIVRVPFSRAVYFNPIIVTISTRTSPYKNLALSNSPYRFIEVKGAFEPAKVFYTPRYISYRIKTFKDYGVIHWEPEAVFTKDSATQLKIVETNLSEIDFHIEGITSDGDLISTTITTQNTQKP
jgi:hypothetical protein